MVRAAGSSKTSRTGKNVSSSWMNLHFNLIATDLRWDPPHQSRVHGLMDLRWEVGFTRRRTASGSKYWTRTLQNQQEWCVTLICDFKYLIVLVLATVAVQSPQTGLFPASNSTQAAGCWRAELPREIRLCGTTFLHKKCDISFSLSYFHRGSPLDT